ncbi:MAG: adenylate/guanylate cyclase domain-containing protein [Acidobacteriota bacterium]
MEYKLEYLKNEEQKSFHLKVDEINIGKLPGNEFQLEDNSISRKHCKLEKFKDTYKIIDMGSTNGTYVNGKRELEKILSIGDNITIGRTIIKFLQVKAHKEISDIDDQKISMVIPLSDNLKLEKEKESITSELDLMSSLTNLGKSLIASTSLEESFEKVGKLIFNFINPRRLSIFSYDDSQDELELKYTQSNEKGDGHVNISKTIAMKSIREKVAILSSNAMDDSRFDGAQSIIMYGITSAISIPIWTKNSIYGLIYADTADLNQLFQEKDIEIISIIANFTGLSVEGIKSLNNLNKEKKIRSRLERYHSPAIVSKIMELQDSTTSELTGYKESEASVLFMDIVGFTTRVENMQPMEIGVFLNNFFTEMTDIIFKNGGTLDKYIGDSIMAVFGIPFEIKNHAELSIKAALDMQKRLKEMNKNLSKEEKIDIRIGINSGKLISGDFGSPKRFDYTVIGNTVNIASRLESSMAKPGEIVVSGSVRKKTKDLFIFKDLGNNSLHGISKPVRVFKVKSKK